MRELEATRLCRILLDQADLSPLLNLGSSSQVRESVQPHVGRDWFEPLQRAGISVFHSDLKEAQGVDLAGDILDPAVARELKGRGFRSILLANLLEHVRDRAAVAARPRRPHPRDRTVELPLSCRSGRYRLSPVAGGAGGPVPAEPARACRGVGRAELCGGHAGEGIVRPERAGANAWWALTLPARPKGAASRLHRWRWYSRPYRISIALVRVHD